MATVIYGTPASCIDRVSDRVGKKWKIVRSAEMYGK